MQALSYDYIIVGAGSCGTRRSDFSTKSFPFQLPRLGRVHAEHIATNIDRKTPRPGSSRCNERARGLPLSCSMTEQNCSKRGRSDSANLPEYGYTSCRDTRERDLA